MKVLLAEDSPTIRQLLTLQLAEWDFQVVQAKDGAEAWELFQEEPFSLVLTDWMMPRMDGLELIRLIRAAETPHYVYVVLLTAKSGKEDLIHAMDAGADDFLVKPCDDGELRVRLREGMRILELERTLGEKNLALQTTQAALVHSEKMAGVGQLAAGMAHEINNPVAYVSNNLSVLRRDVAGVMEILQAYRACRRHIAEADPQAAGQLDQLEKDHDLEWIQENIETLVKSSLGGLARVRDIVKNLRDFARLDEAEFDYLDLRTAIDATVAVMRNVIDGKRLNVRREFSPAPRVYCRPAKIHQVLHNVLLNAIQASHSGGEIRIALSGDEQSALIDIQDQGVGIDEETLPKIFEPFFTTKPVGEGAGLGLAFCYGVMRNHGGSIDVSSRAGEGTTVRLRLPVSAVPKNSGSN